MNFIIFKLIISYSLLLTYPWVGDKLSNMEQEALFYLNPFFRDKQEVQKDGLKIHPENVFSAMALPKPDKWYLEVEGFSPAYYDKVNLANTSRFRLGTSLSSNISEHVDFTFSTRASYNVVENSLRPALNNNFFNQSTRLRYNWILWEGLVYRTELNHQLNSGLSADFDNSFLLWNMSIGKKLFRNQLGELSLNVYDLLKQNNNIRRNVTEAYVEDVQSNVLQRYFMLTFTYNIRHFS